jgi:hypothetical protein
MSKATKKDTELPKENTSPKAVDPKLFPGGKRAYTPDEILRTEKQSDADRLRPVRKRNADPKLLVGKSLPDLNLMIAESFEKSDDAPKFEDRAQAVAFLTKDYIPPEDIKDNK